MNQHQFQELFESMPDVGINPIKAPIYCKDGFSMSVQASYIHYCSPRKNTGPWETFEVGFPTMLEPKLYPFMEMRDGEPTQSVYGWVPIKVLIQIIAWHGGLRS